ncbi:hypothetical protein EDB87DRAFT_1644132 [Lactarius vividus]|nr:hypothetical protein EDB87DRAFT_1644132 [Lactarius vividus]
MPSPSPSYTFTSALYMFATFIPLHLSFQVSSVYLRGCRVSDLHSMRKFLQFLSPAHLVATAIIIYSVASPPETEPILIAVQLLWIYFHVIAGTLAALALATDLEPSVPLDQKLDKKPDPLFTIHMT